MMTNRLMWTIQDQIVDVYWLEDCGSWCQQYWEHIIRTWCERVVDGELWELMWTCIEWKAVGTDVNTYLSYRNGSSSDKHKQRICWGEEATS